MKKEDNEEAGKKLTRKEITDRLFKMLCAFADYCDNHRIRYYLCSGTLLGAIRQKDIIPWDNDLDVLVPRPDYDRLICSVKENLSNNYALFAYEKGNSFYPHAKLVDIETYIYDPSLGIPHLWMDIFPLDGLPNNIILSGIWLRIAQGLKRFPSWSSLPYLLWRPSFGKQLARLVFVPPVKIIGRFFGGDFWTKFVIRYALVFQFESSHYVGGVVSSSGPGERMLKEDFLTITEVNIRNRTFHAPSCWEEYLDRIIGKNWRIQPKKEQLSKVNKVYLIE